MENQKPQVEKIYPEYKKTITKDVSLVGGYDIKNKEDVKYIKVISEKIGDKLRLSFTNTIDRIIEIEVYCGW